MNWFRTLFVVGVMGALVGLPPESVARNWEEQDFWGRAPKVYGFTPPGKVPLDQVATVIGQNRTHRPEKGDTFLDLARYYGIGFNEIEDANPHSDEWIPDQVGEPLRIPTEFVLPAGVYEGIVVNIPEMRLYYYPPAKGGARTVITFPVGLGREDWKTPVGKFKIREKTVNPTWVIPESIRKERVADKGFSETLIPGGSPDNPLGKYRMRLTLNLYGIHGTNIPWGVGMLVSHGCVRLYPEDIDRLYPMTPVGTPGEFVYQPVKVGIRDGRVFVEVHKDLYGKRPGPWREAVALLKGQGLFERVDEKKLLRVVEAQDGVPADVTRTGFGSPSNGDVEPPGRPAIPAPPPAPLPAQRAEETTPSGAPSVAVDQVSAPARRSLRFLVPEQD